MLRVKNGKADLLITNLSYSNSGLPLSHSFYVLIRKELSSHSKRKCSKWREKVHLFRFLAVNIMFDKL